MGDGLRSRTFRGFRPRRLAPLPLLVPSLLVTGLAPGHAVAGQEIPSSTRPRPPASRLPDVRAVEPAARSVLVGDLRDAAARRRFAAEVRQVCGREAELAEERAADPAPAGTVIGQEPEPGARLSCLRPAVTLRISAGPEQTRPADDVTRPGSGQPETVAAITMPRLATGRDLDLFLREVGRQCRQLPEANRSTTASDAPAGTVLEQRPAPGSTFPCTRLPEIAVRLSSGPAGPQPPPRFPIGDLSSARARAALEARAARLCDAPFRVSIRPEPSPLAEGSFLSQSPPPGTLFACDLAIEVRVAAPQPQPEPQPTPSPEPEPQPAPRPEPPPPLPPTPPDPSGPAPAEPVAAEPAGPGPDPGMADATSPRPAAVSTGAGGPRPATPWGWIAAAALLVAALALLALRGFRILRPRAPRPGPAPAIRQGVPTISAEPAGALARAGPDLALRWSMGRATAHLPAEPAILKREPADG